MSVDVTQVHDQVDCPLTIKLESNHQTSRLSKPKTSKTSNIPVYKPFTSVVDYTFRPYSEKTTVPVNLNTEPVSI